MKKILPILKYIFLHVWALIIFLLSFNLMNVYLTKITVNAELKNEIHSNKSLKKIPAFYDAEGGGMWATGAYILMLEIENRIVTLKYIYLNFLKKLNRS